MIEAQQKYTYKDTQEDPEYNVGVRTTRLYSVAAITVSYRTVFEYIGQLCDTNIRLQSLKGNCMDFIPLISEAIYKLLSCPHI